MKQYLLEKQRIIKEFSEKHGQKALLWFGMLLMGAIGFEAGTIQGRMDQPQALVIEKSGIPAVPKVAGESVEANTDTNSNTVKPTGSNAPSSGQKLSSACRFVGSKNSNKYHLPTCAFAKRIKPENRVCFSSEEDAQSKGYQAGCVK